MDFTIFVQISHRLNCYFKSFPYIIVAEFRQQCFILFSLVKLPQVSIHRHLSSQGFCKDQNVAGLSIRWSRVR